MKEQILDALFNSDATQDWRGFVVVAVLALPAVIFWLMRGNARRRRRISVDAMAGEEGPDLPPPSDGGVGYWLRANMAPRSNPPNPRRDLEYFSFLYAAAAAGHPEAQVRLGYLSLSYRAFVECYFWLSLARARGISEVEEPLADCREAWISAGYPGAEDSLSRNFDAGQAAVGLAMLDIDTGRDVERGVFTLTEQEMAGNPAAIEVFRALRQAVCRAKRPCAEGGKGRDGTASVASTRKQEDK